MPPEPLRLAPPAGLRSDPAEGPHNLRDALPRPAMEGASPLLVEPREAARLLAISERTLWALTDRGELPCVRLGRAKRYAVDDLKAYVERLRDEAAAQANGMAPA